jgi:hypothetical protein
MFLFFSTSVWGQFEIISITPNSAMPGEKVTLRVNATDDVQFSFNCLCTKTAPKCISMKKDAFQMIFEKIDFVLSGPGGYPSIVAVASIKIEKDRSNYFDISFTIPSDQVYGAYDLIVYSNKSRDCRLYKNRIFYVGETMDKHVILTNNNFFVFPNPTDQKLNVQFEAPSPATVRFYDATNRLIYEKSPISSNEILDISFLSKGIYSVVLVYNGQNIGFQKLFII